MKVYPLAVLAACFASLAGSAAPSQPYSIGDPSGLEQYSLELINRARMNPTAEGVILASFSSDPVIGPNYTGFQVNLNQLMADFAAIPAQPPLAFNSALISASRFQSQDQVNNNYQGHVFPVTGVPTNTLQTRLATAQYPVVGTTLGENVFARIPSALFAYVGLNVDFGQTVLPLPHRTAIMNINLPVVFKEFGAGFVTGSGSNVSPMVTTQVFATSANDATTPFLTGVAYRDRDLDSFYSAGEGLGGITVMPDVGTFFAITSSSGGYTIPLKNLPVGTSVARLTFSGGALTTPVTKDVTLNGIANVKADLIQPVVRLINISTRLRVETGDNVAIAGFVVGGTGPKKVLVRALGPGLTAFGVQGVLADPRLDLANSQGTILASNDSWKATQQAEITASGFKPSFDVEPAIVATLTPGAYTAIVRGAGTSTGVAIVEVYDLDLPADSYPLNVSTRGVVQSGDNVMIGGFVVKGSKPKKVIVRAIGPTLANFGVRGPLLDPQLSLVDGTGATIASNNNWRDTQEAEIQATRFVPSDDREAAIVRTLNPGTYTAIVSGVAGTTGVALVEVYDLD